MPRYADYHRTVVGYHGTRRATALKIVQGDLNFELSTNKDDWLGHGVYFWEYAPQQAFLWAEDRKRKNQWDDEIAVLGSMIRLGNCFDLLDPENVKSLDRYHKSYRKTSEEVGKIPVNNHNSDKYLNCEVFQYAYASHDGESADRKIDTCRAVFVPTDSKDRNKRLWTGSGINRDAHIQVCVRNLRCILGTWLVKPMED